MSKTLIYSFLAVCVCVLISCNADNMNGGATSSIMNKSILRQIPDLARVTKLTAKCNYTSPQGEAINIPEFEVPPDQWNDLVETLAHSTDIDTDDDMTFCGTIQFTTAEGDGIEIWLLKSRRMHYTVLGKAGTTKFVADTEGQEILNLIEKIHAGEEGGSSPK